MPATTGCSFTKSFKISMLFSLCIKAILLAIYRYKT